MEGSKSFKINSLDWKKIGVGAGVAIVGALLTYVSSWITDVDFYGWTPIVVAVWSVIANIGRKWVADNS